MLTGCGCVANAEQTQILRPCQLHAEWAIDYAAKLHQLAIADDARRGRTGEQVRAMEGPAPR